MLSLAQRPRCDGKFVGPCELPLKLQPLRALGSLGTDKHPVGSINEAFLAGSESSLKDRVEGFGTIAERRRRVGRTKSAIQPARIRSHEDRVGDRCRERFTIRSWRLSRRDSAMRERTPPAGLPVPFALQRHERVEGRTRWFRSVPSPSPPRTRIQNLKAVLPVWAQALRFGIAG
jgi:hypothetical protein